MNSDIKSIIQTKQKQLFEILESDVMDKKKIAEGIQKEIDILKNMSVPDEYKNTLEALKLAGYIYAFKNNFIFLYHPITKKCMNVKAKFVDELKNTRVTYTHAELPEHAMIELWHNGMKLARHSVKHIETEYGTLEAWRLERKQSMGGEPVEVTFSLDLSNENNIPSNLY